MFQLALALDPDEAGPDIEALIARQQTCAIHQGTTLDYGVCDLCELEAPRTPAWVRRAAEARLPCKVYR